MTAEEIEKEQSNPPPARLYAILARQTPYAIIFRRGPSKQVQLIGWNLQNDTFEPGQWFKGRIYERRCDLSPDGRLLVYFAARQSAQSPGETTWTALSRPPYLTALSLWFKGDTWSGGGLFENNNHLKLNEGGARHHLDPASAKPNIKVSSLETAQGEDGPIELLRLRRDGWQLRQEMETRNGSLQTDWELAALDPTHRDVLIQAVRALRKQYYAGSKVFRTEQPRIIQRHIDKGGRFVLQKKAFLLGLSLVELFEVLGELSGPRPALTGTDWADCDTERERVVFARSGRIYAWQPGLTEPLKLADFNAKRFEKIPAPDWAKKW